MSFEVGSLVRARGREWVILPESDEQLLKVRPLGGSPEEITGLYRPLEDVEPARFDLPDPEKVGDNRSCALLRSAARLSSRSSTGPFRCLGRIAVDPRPYQFVPLLVALKQDPVRILIADDVGIGKTIEACLIGRELLDRGEISRTAVLCPPHLAEQWRSELREKFHIEPELVLRSTASRLERRCTMGQSLFDVYNHVVVSMDFIKSDRRRNEFVRTCPEFVIVDEAHTCASAGGRARGAKQRHQLVSELSRDPDRHLVLVTATPHSGKEDAFRSLLCFLNRDFKHLPDDLTGDENKTHRRRLAQYFVQRRRKDIEYYLESKTVFPERNDLASPAYQLTPEYKRFFDKVIRYARRSVKETGASGRSAPVRWWSALALLRCVGSSPRATAETLKKRSVVTEEDDPEKADEVGRRRVMDSVLDDQGEVSDGTPGSIPEEETDTFRRRFRDLRREAEKLEGESDAKLLKAAQITRKLVSENKRPIVFCRFIPTALYVAEEFRKRLPKDVEIAPVTGNLPPDEREKRILELGRKKKPVLVCTDCLSEGINLQEHFDTVFHYDLSWNPMRHEQRAGRVDRFGQKRSHVYVVTYWGKDNPVDEHVWEILIKKHNKIRSSLGISVPIPVEAEDIVNAIVEGLLYRESREHEQALLPGMEEYLRPKTEKLKLQWENAREREKLSQTMFAQKKIKPAEELALQIREARSSICVEDEVCEFTKAALRAHKAMVHGRDGHYRFELSEIPQTLRDRIDESYIRKNILDAGFEPSRGEGAVYLSRTHPVVESLASYVLETAFDPQMEGEAKRAGAIYTDSVSRRSTLLLVRFRYRLIRKRGSEERMQLAEECKLIGFSGSPSQAVWLSQERAEELLRAKPALNMAPEKARNFVSRVTENIDSLMPRLKATGEARANALLESHKGVRRASRLTGVKYQVKLQYPPDILGIYVYLPVPGGHR